MMCKFITVGNLFSYYDDVVTVKEVHEDKVVILDSGDVLEEVDPNELQPIPVTKEFLEEKGFKEVYSSHIQTKYEKWNLEYRLMHKEGVMPSGLMYNGALIPNSDVVHRVQNLYELLKGK